MIVVLAFKNYALLVHLFKTDFTYGIFFLKLYLHFFGDQDQKKASEDLNREFFHYIISLQEGVRYANEDEIRAGEEKDKFVEKYAFACPIPYQLKYQKRGESPFENENCDKRNCLILNEPAHEPVEEGGRNHADRSEADVNGNQDDPLQRRHPIQA